MSHKLLLKIILFLIITTAVFACENEKDSSRNEEANELDNSIQGKIICGYQGWFNAEGDGANLGWKHYKNSGKFEPGMCSIDYWPDLTEFDSDELYATSFNHADGSQASVFSSAHPKTVDRHFKWMKDYGIDGVFIQRFVSNVKNETLHANLNQVFDNCYNASTNHERLISVMYDLSGSGREVVENAKKDWKQLVDKYQINNPENPNLLTHKNKIVVAIWGVGFNDGRKYTLDDIQELIEFFKNDPVYGNCSVLLGVPTGWRTLDRDC
ncbi:MAG: xylosidase, partial [Cyclobacteriaceae bacterium]|nr:xylosidase [Cyclobacteriaceae bacterium]